jgi:hypothetical protein
LLSWVSRNAETNSYAHAALELYRSEKWDGQSLRTLQITIAKHNLWNQKSNRRADGALVPSYRDVLEAITREYAADRPESAYQYTLVVYDDDDPVTIERAEIYKVGDIIPLTFIDYQVVGGRCTLDCGPFSHFVLDCVVLHS